MHWNLAAALLRLGILRFAELNDRTAITWEIWSGITTLQGLAGYDAVDF